MIIDVEQAIQKHCKKLGLDFKDLDFIGESETKLSDITLKIIRDEDCESPREWDNVGTMVCWHNNYRLGDKQPDVDHESYRTGMVEEFEPGFQDMLERLDAQWVDFSSEGLDELEALTQKKIESRLEKYFFILPLYLYDHSGLSISTSRFSCGWDSGQVGFIYVSKKKAREEYGFKRLTKERIKKVYAYLESEVENYDAYLQGDAYGFIVESEKTDIEDSCWGFLGPDGEAWAIEAALSNLVADKETRRKTRFEQIKTWIRNNVPLLNRTAMVSELPALW